MMTPVDAPECTAVIAQEWLPGYELLGEIGAGGFGTVYKARQLKLDRLVAVKVIKRDLMADPDQAARFETEAIILGKFRHPNIVQVYDLGSHGGRLYLAEELLEGEDLGARLKRDGRLDDRTVWPLIRQAAAGLAHASLHGVVHRDIKPANLFLAPPPTGVDWPAGVPLVKVMDFGIAHVKWAVDSDGFPRTHQGSVVGTPAYMAPEQHQGVEDIDHRADLYALGATAYHALTGQMPFAGKTVWDVMARKFTDTPVRWNDLTPASAELIRAMLAPDRSERIQTYAELIDRIDALGIGKLVSRCRSRKWERLRSSLRRWVALIGVAGFGVATGFRYAARPDRPTGPPAPEMTYVSAGPQQLLFTGSKDIFAWRAPEAGGNWSVETDQDRNAVLAGMGFARRTYPPFDEYRILLGLDIHAAARAEVHFAIPARSAESLPRYVLRVTRAEGAVLGTQVGSRGAFTPRSDPVPFPPEAWFADRQPYLEVKIDRTAGGWVVSFNGTPAGRLLPSSYPTADEFRLFADGGKARVDSAGIEPIRKD